MRMSEDEEFRLLVMESLVLLLKDAGNGYRVNYKPYFDQANKVKVALEDLKTRIHKSKRIDLEIIDGRGRE